MPRSDVTTSIGSWDFHSIHVEEDLIAGEFINAESTLICAGPPRLPQSTGDDPPVYPIGLVENAGVSQSKQLQRVFEIGSARSYFVPGRVVGSFSVGRVIFNGNSLMRVKYAWTVLDGAVSADMAGLEAATLANLELDDELLSEEQLRPNPGYGGAVFNLGSNLFNQPYGMLFLLRDQTDLDWAEFYLENCYIQGHQMSISSGSVLLLEACSSQFDQLVPVAVQEAS